MADKNEKGGLLGWFTSNHVAANLLMALILIGGFLSIMRIKMEVFPEFSLDTITVTVPYRGASPEDVEQGVTLRVEEAVAGIDGVKQITSNSAENSGTTIIEVEEYADTQEVLDDVKAEVDRIITFPVETEKPVIAEIKTVHPVITIVVFGDATEKTLKVLADGIRDELTAKDNISQVSVAGVRPYEIAIEISEETLRRYNLSFDQVAMAVRSSSLDIPAGSVKTAGGEILVRTKGQRYYGPEFEKIIVVSRKDGTKICLSDIAIVKDDFEDTDLFSKFDGKRAALIKVSRIGAQDALDVANTVKKYVEEEEGSLPAGISLALWNDDSKILKSRISLLTRNGYIGLTLVFLCLALFLDLRLAFWTTMGIPISFMGAFWLMPVFGITINMMSLFALIMSLGLVVDDAIVVGENIFSYKQKGMDPLAAAIKGVKEMSIPVFLAVATTVFAFLPLSFTTGILGKILRIMPLVVMSVLIISLVESLFILPAHLSGKFSLRIPFITWFAESIRVWVDIRLQKFINGRFAKAVEFAVKYRYITIATGLTVFIMIIGFIAGGYIKFVFFDAVEADNIVASLVMPQGTPVEQTTAVAERLEKAALDTLRELDEQRPGLASLMKHISTTVGSQPASAGGGPGHGGSSVAASAHLAEINIELLGGEDREVSSTFIKNKWRDKVGEIAGISSLKFVSEIFSAGDDVNVELTHKNFDKLLEASEDLKEALTKFAGISEISDSFEEGKAELKLALKDSGRNLGLTLGDLARQVRQGFYGEEIQRIQRGRDDVRVMLRYPKEDRKSIADIENMRIRLPDGTEIPFNTVAEVDYGRGYATIKRVDRKRVVNVSADVDEKAANAKEINAEIYASVLPELASRYPGLSFETAGAKKEQDESLGSMKTNFVIALLAIYAILAVQFKSYAQPLIVMSAIPFGIIGATIGHLLLGYNLSILSMFGIVALSGVVVNDSLIIIDLINRERESGIELSQVIRDSATRRFRPIMLTTLTTFFGLFPMILEKSLQARFLVPMAISLAFGVLFATMITLFLVPSLYMALVDIKVKLTGSE